MREFVAKCERGSKELSRIGADPEMKGEPLHFSWNDIMDGLRRRCCKMKCEGAF